MHSKFANIICNVYEPLAFSIYAAFNTDEKFEKTFLEIERQIFIFVKKRTGNPVNVDLLKL
jgi:hypothetical protein